MKNSVSWVIDATPYVDMSIFTVFFKHVWWACRSHRQMVRADQYAADALCVPSIAYGNVRGLAPNEFPARFIENEQPVVFGADNIIAKVSRYLSIECYIFICRYEWHKVIYVVQIYDIIAVFV